MAVNCQHSAMRIHLKTNQLYRAILTKNNSVNKKTHFFGRKIRQFYISQINLAHIDSRQSLRCIIQINYKLPAIRKELVWHIFINAQLLKRSIVCIQFICVILCIKHSGNNDSKQRLKAHRTRPKVPIKKTFPNENRQLVWLGVSFGVGGLLKR